MVLLQLLLLTRFCSNCSFTNHVFDDCRNLPLNRSNDGKCDPRGRFWLGTMSLKADRGAGNMWCLDTDGTVQQRCTEQSLSICNGPSWSLDGHHFYFVDTLEGTPLILQGFLDSIVQPSWLAISRLHCNCGPFFLVSRSLPFRFRPRKGRGRRLSVLSILPSESLGLETIR